MLIWRSIVFPCLLCFHVLFSSYKVYSSPFTTYESIITYELAFSLFSSPELKAQVSFSNHLSSVVCLSVCPSVCLSVCKLFTFSSSSPEPQGLFQPNLAQSILGWRGFKFVQIKGPTLFQGEIITKWQNA